MTIKPMYAGRVNSPPTTLTKAISATDTTIEVADGSVLPAAPNYVTIGTNDAAETILYTTKTGNILSGVTRNVESGSGAKAWLLGEIIGRNFTNKDHQNLIDNIVSLDEGKTKRINLTGQLQKVGYMRSVIAFCELTNIPNLYSASKGFLSLSRTNGVRSGTIIEIGAQRSYTLENMRCDYKLISGQYDIIKPCRFKYNGVLYGGLDIYISYLNLENIEFNGATNFPIFGLDYYNTQTSTPINQEVYDSLVYDGIEQGGIFEFNGKKVLTEAGGIVSDNITPATANTVDLGSAALPFRGVFSNSMQQGQYKERYLGYRTTTTGAANEKFDILLPNISFGGSIEVEISSGYAYYNASGRIAKQSHISLGVSSINSQQAYYTTVGTTIGTFYAISDIKYDATKGKYITIAKRDITNANDVHVLIRLFGVGSIDITQITLSSIYTTDTTVFPEPLVTMPKSPAIGSNDLQFASTEFFQKELGAISRNILPNSDNVLSIGSASKRWKDFYLASGTISTSDKREKKSIADISEAYKNFFYELRPVSFEFNEGIRTHLGLISQEVEEAMYKSGLNLLDFAGFINSPITELVKSDEMEEREVEEESIEEQEIEEEVIEEQEVGEEETYLDENGEEQVLINTVVKNVPVMKTVKRLVPVIKTVKRLVPKMKTVITGERYGLRYEEFVPLLIKMTQLQQGHIDELEKRIAKIEKEGYVPTVPEVLPEAMGMELLSTPTMDERDLTPPYNAWVGEGQALSETEAENLEAEKTNELNQENSITVEHPLV